MEFLAVSKRDDSKDWLLAEKKSKRSLESDKIYFSLTLKKKSITPTVILYVGKDICEIIDIKDSCNLLIMVNKNNNKILKIKGTENKISGYRFSKRKDMQCYVTYFRLPKDLKIDLCELKEINFDIMQDKSIILNFNHER